MLYLNGINDQIYFMNNRGFTNIIRYFMDEWLPPAIRDSKFFMYPFYYYAYKGKNIKEVMHLKQKVFQWSEKELSNFYTNRDTRFSNSRPTDLSQKCIDYMFDRISSSNSTLLDVGCGAGYFLDLANKKGFITTGCDIISSKSFKHSSYYQGSVEKLPFDEDAFDVVTCSHTLEHVVNFDKAVDELKRVAKKTLCVVVPCQRAYYYTLDEHVRFFPYKWMLEQEMKMKFYTCKKVHGDLVFIADMAKEKSKI